MYSDKIKNLLKVKLDEKQMERDFGSYCSDCYFNDMTKQVPFNCKLLLNKKADNDDYRSIGCSSEDAEYIFKLSISTILNKL